MSAKRFAKNINTSFGNLETKQIFLVVLDMSIANYAMIYGPIASQVISDQIYNGAEDLMADTQSMRAMCRVRGKLVEVSVAVAYSRRSPARTHCSFIN